MVLADSRDPDIKKFDETTYKLIEIETGKITRLNPTYNRDGVIGTAVTSVFSSNFDVTNSS
jgi:hypothetical protein